jgi:predicted thioesterase
MSELKRGIHKSLQRRVGAEMTASQHGNPGFDVLATPALVGLIEETCIGLLEGLLDAKQATVGGRIEVDHVAPTPVGGAVSVNATLDNIDGRRLEFDVVAQDNQEVIARGRHVRYVIEREGFLDRVATKATDDRPIPVSGAGADRQ